MNAFLRILRYIIRYRMLMVLSVLCSLGYAAMNWFAYGERPTQEALSKSVTKRNRLPSQAYK